MKRNIVVLFDNQLNNQLISLSQQINTQIPSKIVLNTVNKIPHMTLYTSIYPSENLEKIKSKLSSLAKRFKQFDIMFSSKTIDVGSIFINAKLSKKLSTLHSNIVDELNKLRNGNYDEKELLLIGKNIARKKSLIKYGMWAAKKLYVPHISISRPHDPDKLDDALKMLPNHFNYVTPVKSINLVETGENGTCKKILETYYFENN